VTLRILTTPTALQRTIGSQVIDKVRREWRDIGVILTGILPYISVVVVRDGHQASKSVSSFFITITVETQWRESDTWTHMYKMSSSVIILFTLGQRFNQFHQESKEIPPKAQWLYS